MIPKSAARRLLAYALVLLPIIFNTAAQREIDRATRYQRRYGANAVRCQDVREIYFTAFFPCLRNMGTEPAEVAASGRLGDCDLLAEAAAHLAVERVNRDPTILPNITLKLFPIYTAPREAIGESDFYDLLMQYLDVLNSRMIRDNIWGVIGPDDNIAVASSVLSFTANSGIITASYGLRDTRFDDDIVTLYRTLPSSEVVNIARIVLLASNKWFRIASLGSLLEDHYLQERDNFHMRFSNYLEMLGLSDILLDLSEVFTDSPDSVTTALRRIEERDINIIVGFFGPDNARNVLCLASSIGLVSETHAWILPTYFDPNWWKKGANSSQCSDEEMKSILESVIFIDSVKFPPLDVPLDDFHRQLIAKSLDLFPSLTEEDLKPYLLRSRATNAYDAVTLLAKSVDVAFDQDGNSCTDTSLVKFVLDRAYMTCEYCRLYSECFLNEEQTAACQRLCTSSYQPELSLNTFFTELRIISGDRSSSALPIRGLRSSRILNMFGQILYSQFLDGEECPLYLWWPIRSREHRKSYLAIDDFDGGDSCIARRMNLSRRNFVSNSSKCPTSFNWRGSLQPPSSNFLTVSYVSVGGLVGIGLLVLFGEIVALVLLILNIFLRNNRSVKASSPWLNVIIIVGSIVRLPSPLYYALVLSANKYDSLRGRDLTPLCHCFAWGFYIGGALFTSVLLVKNWRIYKIFNNKRLKSRGTTLTNWWLILEVFGLVAPVVLILIIVSSTGLHFVGIEGQNSNLQVVNITTCVHDRETVYFSILSGYLIAITLLLFILVLLTANIPLSSFRREHVATYRALVIGLLPTFLFTVAQGFLVSLQPTLMRVLALLWLEVAWAALLLILLVAVLAPSILYYIKDKIRAKKELSKERERNKLTGYCEELRIEAEELRSQLEQINMDIDRLKTNSKTSQNTNIQSTTT